jgi:hypothetical protein
MTGRLIIDGQDAFSTYGAYVTFGGYNELISYPALKDVDANDWPDQHGLDPDLSNPVLNLKESSISFANRGPASGFHAFLSAITDEAYHTFNLASIQRSFSLRYVGCSSYDVHDGLGLFALKMADDFPLDGYTYAAPSDGIAHASNFSLDGIPFANYGITPLQGCMSEVLKARDAKENLLINPGTVPGVIYDGQEVYFKSKEVRLNLLIRANTLANLWRNYDAFLYDLIRPNKRTLTVDGSDYDCYYKNANVDVFFPAHNWIKFSITLEFI